ncbi:unnamed protein product [Lasius platythorax]|uniref:Uncharacterized protein n=1 Tax=Lasius platythorax TaxID=488582 RepID=A0AAV2P5W5_9HYME
MTPWTITHWTVSTLNFRHWSASRYKRCFLVIPFSCVVIHSLYTWRIVCIKKFTIKKSNTSARDREDFTLIPITSGNRTFKTTT